MQACGHRALRLPPIWTVTRAGARHGLENRWHREVCGSRPRLSANLLDAGAGVGIFNIAGNSAGALAGLINRNRPFDSAPATNIRCIMITSRRSFITGLVSLIAAPAIVRAASLMPVKRMLWLSDGVSLRSVPHPHTTGPWSNMVAGDLTEDSLIELMAEVRRPYVLAPQIEIYPPSVFYGKVQ